MFNLDEISVAKWQNREPKSVIISMEMKECLIRQKVRRTINHLTVLTCVAASSEAFSPMIVISRAVPDNI
jgi:hypothetical protein